MEKVDSKLMHVGCLCGFQAYWCSFYLGLYGIEIWQVLCQCNAENILMRFVRLATLSCFLWCYEFLTFWFSNLLVLDLTYHFMLRWIQLIVFLYLPFFWSYWFQDYHFFPFLFHLAIVFCGIAPCTRGWTSGFVFS